MKTLKNWTLDTQSANHLELLVDSQHRLCLYVLEENLFRVLIKRKGELALDRTRASHRKRRAVGRSPSRRSERLLLPRPTLTQQEDTLTVATEQLRVTVHQPLWLEWHYRNDAGEWQPLVNDRPTSAYLLNAHGDGVAHYLSRRKDERFYGPARKRAICSATVNAMRCVTSTRWDTTPPAPTRCTSTFRSPSPAATT